jgi:RNA-directed DNA polymerase
MRARKSFAWHGRPNTTRPWVFDADIEGAFNNIGHTALLQAIGNFPARELALT